MKEGTKAVLLVDGKSYPVSYYKVNERVETFFDGNVEIKADLDLSIGTPYSGRLVVNGDACWYFPWLWRHEDSTKLTTHGAIFCPFGLSEAEEKQYDSLNLIIASDVCYTMTGEVWKGLMLIFADWLRAKSIPQYQEYLDFVAEMGQPSLAS